VTRRCPDSHGGLPSIDHAAATLLRSPLFCKRSTAAKSMRMRAEPAQISASTGYGV
jgi:hypothetical protein